LLTSSGEKLPGVSFVAKQICNLSAFVDFSQHTLLSEYMLGQVLCITQHIASLAAIAVGA
jgi:hypothetical protein